MTLNSKYLIVGGTHGNEYTGIELVKYLRQNPIENMKPLIANIDASELNLRFVETNLQNAFGVQHPISLEEIRALEISPILAKSDFIIDFHNTIDQNMTCGIVTTNPNDFHFSICTHLNISKIVQFPPGNTLIGQYPDKSISIEISNSDTHIYSTETIYQNLKKISGNKQIQASYEITQYKFVRQLPKPVFDRLFKDLGYLYNFTELTQKQKEVLSLPTDRKFYPVFRGAVSHFTNNIFCSIVEPIHFK